ncbi:MAG: protein kinase [Candidatus Aminicenantes bacterium]
MTNRCPNCNIENPSDSKYCKECATPLLSQVASFTKTLETSKDELTTGSTFAGRYQIIEELGKGGMGKVYRALDKKLNEEVALKLIKPEVVSDKKTLERFSNELKIARRISHKNIGRMYELMEEKDIYFITMEYVPGEDLKSFIRRSGQLAVGTTLRIAAQVCEGLSEAHKLGVVHRDLKPHNIMIDKQGNAKIMDFGIARFLKAESITGEGIIVGTPEYMSPEQAEAKETDHRSDIYSLGIILYEMLTSQIPFGGDTPLSIAMKQKGEIPKGPQELNPEVPDALNHLILKCLEKDRRQRYQSAGEVQSELNGIKEGITTTEKMLPKSSLEKKPKRSLFMPYMVPGLLIVSAVIVALLFISISGVLKKGTLETEIRTEQIWQYKIVVLPFENLGPPDDQYFADGITEEITSRLASVRDLGVISRQTAVQYDRTGKTVNQIRDDIGVDYILEGTVRWDREEKKKSKILVTPQLIRASDDTHVWSDRYSRILDDIFTVQSDIAEQVIRQIDATLLRSFQSSRQTKPTENLEAYDLYLRGIEFLGPAPLESEHQEAIRMLEQAVALDPEFALAYTRLSRSHSAMYHYGYDRTEYRKKKAMETSLKALELEPNLPEVHWSLGHYYYSCFKDYGKALEEFSIVEKSLPNEERILSYVGYILRRQGRFNESLDRLVKAFQLNPVSIMLINNIAYSHMILRNYKEAADYYRRSISLAPDQQMAYQELAFNYILWKGDIDEAERIIEKMPKDENPESFWYWIELDLVARNYKKALDRIASSSLEVIMDQGSYQPIEQYSGLIYHLMNDQKQSSINYDLARAFLEEKIREQPDDSRIHSSLGIVYAMIGRKEDAIREGRLGVDLYPISKDALFGPSRLESLAYIYTILSMYKEAIEQIEHLLSIPCFLSVPMLKLHPRWDPIREHSGFQRLLKKYSKIN